MKFKVKRREPHYTHKYPRESIVIARKFAKKVYKELGEFVVALTLFGSAAKGKKARDIDILIIIDDVHVQLSKELVETYRIIIGKAVAAVDPERLHVQTVKWTTFWEYVRAGDPVAINILRDSIALIDIGFFDPLQILLNSGRIRPTREAVWTYFAMAPASMHRASTRLDLAVIDLYWAVIDAAHAALMSFGEIPPSPSHVAHLINEKMVKPGIIPARYAYIMNHMYQVSKRIMYREIRNLDGKRYDKYRRLAEDFVRTMRRVINSRKESI